MVNKDFHYATPLMRKRLVCSGSDTPNYLCGGDIDMYIPLEKPNT